MLLYFIALRWTLYHDASCLQFHPAKYTYVIAILLHSNYKAGNPHHWFSTFRKSHPTTA